MNIYLKFLIVLAGLLIFISAFLAIEIYLSKRGPKTGVPNVSNAATVLGKGTQLTFLVLGDSTSAGQGGNYDKGIAVASAKFLANNNQVYFYNFSVSGAKINDVLIKQWPKAKKVRPDIILVAVGANDTTGLTTLTKISSDFDKLINDIIDKNCNMKIILTGSPDMGTVPRLVEPLRSFAGWRSREVNKSIDSVAAQYKIVRAPILEKTGPVFAKDPSLFAVDKYHPNDRGYAVWIPILEASIADAKASQPSHCKS